MKKKNMNVRTGSKTKSVSAKKDNVSYFGIPSKSVLQKIAGKIQTSMKQSPDASSACTYCIPHSCSCACDCACLCACLCACSCDCACYACACACACDCACIDCVSECHCTYCPRSNRAEDYPSGWIEQIDEHLKELESLVQYRFSDIRVILKGLSQRQEQLQRSQVSVKNKFGDIEEILNQIPQKAEIPTNPSKRKRSKHT